MRVALGSDLAGELPDAIERWLRERNHEVVKFGALAPRAAAVAQEMLEAFFSGTPTNDPVYRAMIADLE